MTTMRLITYSTGILLTLFALGCDNSSTSNLCANLGCASFPGVLYLTVTDTATGTIVANPTFTVQLASRPSNPVTLTPICTKGADPTCGEWQFPLLDEGSDIITITAPAYGTASITVQISGPTECCGQGPDVRQSVGLHKP